MKIVKELKNKKKLIVVIIAGLLIVSLGLSLAYFDFNIIGSETDTTIIGEGGTMRIDYDGGAIIESNIMFPDDAPFATKNFTVTGFNDTDLAMNYNISLIVTTNTFSHGGIKYKLTSTNTGSNGIVVPSISTMKDLATGTKDILLGNGSFTAATGGDKIHTYSLELYYPITGGDQSYDQGKLFNAYVLVEKGIGASNEYLTDAIFDDYGGASSITEAPAGTFANINGSTDNLMYKMEDDYGMSYYLRGSKDYVNNNIIFAEHQWKIVRINGDGSVRLIYNGTCPGNTCTINTTGTTTQIGTSAFNTNYNDNKYLGYMYGGAAGTASTSRAQATTNETNSTIKTYLDTWYANNILNTDYEDYISDTLFCNDRQLQSEVGGAATGTGFGTSETFYAALQRLYFAKSPNLKCGLKNDRFTVSDTVKGNGALTYPIGLLTPDETAIAGLKNGTSNYTNYLHTNQYWWTLGPSLWSIGYANAWFVNSSGYLSRGYDVDNGGGVRGVLNLKSETQITGTGTTSDPFKVV